MHNSSPKKILYAMLLGSAVFIQLVAPAKFAVAAIPGLGGVAGGTLCGIPGAPAGLEVPVADKTVRSATKVTCSNVAKQTLKEYLLDTLAYIAVHTLLRAMTNQILGWIQGTDADFIQNLEDEFIRSADAEGGALLNELSPVNLCGNIGAFLKLSIGTPFKKSFRQRMACTATQAVNNIEGFYNNFTQGGWDAFLKISLQPQNNAYGAFMLAMNEQFQRSDNKQISLQQRLAEGGGFLGFSAPRDTNCQNVSLEDAAILQENLKVQQQVWGKENKPEQSLKENLSDPENPTYSFCDVAYDTKTPGSLFSAALPEAVFSDKRRAEIADEINESVAQIVMALLNKVIEASSGSGKGILGSKEITQLPLVTPSDYKFTPTYLTNKTDDMSLRLQTAQKNLDAKIQTLDAKIIALNKEIADLQASCDDADELTICDLPKITSLIAQKPALIAERLQQLVLLQRADQDIKQILDLRAQILATADIDELQILDTKLGNVLTDAEEIVVQAGGPTSGVAVANPNDNIVSMTQIAQQRADSAIAWLEGKIAAENDPDKKKQLKDARDALKKLRDDLIALRADFLVAVQNQSGITEALGLITNKINEINTAITTDYDIFKAP